MIPISLRISGFLSYKDPVELDFSNINLACISGSNGAGKSSILDAMTWVLFGQARKRDESILNSHPDVKMAEVVFTFEYEDQIFRVIRALPRGKTTSLEFQIQAGNDKGEIKIWRSLTEHSVRETQNRIQETLREKAAGATQAYLGRVTVTNQVVGFKKKRQFTEEVLGEEPLDLPPQVFDTVALWFDVPSELGARLGQEGLDFPGGLHATEHAAIGMLPLFAMCDRNDIGGISTARHADTGRPEVFIYDGHPGGVGIAEEGYERIEELWARTLEVVSECACETGCPSCVQSPKCGNNNRPLDKEAARRMLVALLGRVYRGPEAKDA